MWPVSRKLNISPQNNQMLEKDFHQNFLLTTVRFPSIYLKIQVRTTFSFTYVLSTAVIGIKIG